MNSIDQRRLTASAIAEERRNLQRETLILLYFPYNNTRTKSYEGRPSVISSANSISSRLTTHDFTKTDILSRLEILF